MTTAIFGKHERYILPLLPILGVALVVMHQLGRYQFYSVPFELLEVDTVKTLLSGLALGMFSIAALYAVLALHQPTGNKLTRYVIHFSVAVIVTMPFWSPKTGELSWPSIPAILFILLSSAVTFATHTFFAKLKSEDPDSRTTSNKLSIGVLLAFAIALLASFCAFSLGFLLEQRQAKRVFLSDSNLLVAGRLGNNLILKAYDPTTRKILRHKTTLREIKDSTVLEERAISIAID